MSLFKFFLAAGASVATTLASSEAGLSSDPSFDHQTKTYDAKFTPVTVTNEEMSLTPFFSPDHSAQVLVDLINSATKTLDIMTPGIGSWIGCSYASGTGCIGCTVDKMNTETFPAFPALLNAAHRGVKVRILTNNYNNAVCDDTIDMVTFWTLNGIELKWYQTTTFVHAKFVLVDGKTASVSSVNWSQNSFTNNREAGMLISGTGATKPMAFFQSVYDLDWANGDLYTPTQTYSSADMAIITNKETRTVTVPPGPDDRAYITPTPKEITGTVANITVSTSPDFSFSETVDLLNSASKSVDFYVYQITDQGICDAVEALHKRGVDVNLLVSTAIYSSFDQAAATQCYNQLDKAGLTINMAWQYNDYMYCHNKFFIVDGKSVWVSTGNLSPSDMPGPPMTFPPYSAGSSWRDANRDFHVVVEDPDVVSVYATVIAKDLANSTKFSPSGGNNTCAYFNDCGTYVKGQACQCNDSCDKYGNCCPDYQTTCNR